MPALRDLDLVHRLNAPTRAAATRRRRVRKLVAAALVLIAAVIASPSGGQASATRVGQAVDAGGKTSSLQGRHAVTMPTSTPVPPGARGIDVWDSHGARLITCAPLLSNSETGGRLGTVTSPTLAAAISLALTTAELQKIAPHLSDTAADDGHLVFSGCL